MSGKPKAKGEDSSDEFDADGNAELLTRQIHDERIKAKEAAMRLAMGAPRFVDEDDHESGANGVAHGGTSAQDEFAAARARHWETTFQRERTKGDVLSETHRQSHAGMKPAARASRPEIHDEKRAAGVSEPTIHGERGAAKRRASRHHLVGRPSVKDAPVTFAVESSSTTQSTESEAEHILVDQTSEPCRPGAYRQAGINCDAGASDDDEEYEMADMSTNEYSEGHHHRDSQTVQTFQTDAAQASPLEETELVRAKIVDEAETIFEAADVQRDYTRRKFLIIIVGGAIVISLIVSITLFFLLRDDSGEQIDKRCIGPAEELIIPFQCLCLGSTQLAWESLDETAVLLYDDLLVYFQNHSIIDPSIDLEKTGCQGEHQALLALSKQFALEPSRIISQGIPYASLTQAYAFLYVFVELGGIDWILYDNWFVHDVDMCQWHGIDCVFIDTFQKLGLSYNNLRGSLPSVIQYMTDLRLIDLSGNEGIYGTLPTEIGRLSAMTDLSLAEMSISGTIPTELGQMSRAGELLLNSNQLTGTIPSELFQGIPTLRLLQLSNNDLVGSFPPSIDNATRLVELSVDDNGLTGDFPSGLGDLLELEVLNIALNSFGDNVPRIYTLPPRLEFINLYKSGLEGRFATTVCDESLPHPPQRTIALECEETDAIVRCPCCTVSRANREALVFIICGETLPEYAGIA